MLLKLVTRILLRKNKEFIRVVELKGKKYVLSIEEYRPINVIIDEFKEKVL